MDDELRELARAEAERLGMDTSEFIRQAIVAWVAWHTALRVGGKKNAPRDIEAVLRALGNRT